MELTSYRIELSVGCLCDERYPKKSFGPTSTASLTDFFKICDSISWSENIYSKDAPAASMSATAVDLTGHSYL